MAICLSCLSQRTTCVSDYWSDCNPRTWAASMSGIPCSVKAARDLAAFPHFAFCTCRLSQVGPTTSPSFPFALCSSLHSTIEISSHGLNLFFKSHCISVCWPKWKIPNRQPQAKKLTMMFTKSVRIMTSKCSRGLILSRGRSRDAICR